jgi:hypothetical protein
MNDETLQIIDSHGKKLCEIYFLWSRKVWANPDSAIKIMWHQSLVIMQYIIEWQSKSPDSLEDLFKTMEENKSGFPCVSCGESSVYARKSLGSYNGFRCCNEKCGMFNALIPNTLPSHLYEMPVNLQKEFQYMILMNKGGSDRKHWGNFAILKVHDKWDDMNEYIIQEARKGKDWRIMLNEVGFDYQIR